MFSTGGGSSRAGANLLTLLGGIWIVAGLTYDSGGSRTVVLGAGLLAAAGFVRAWAWLRRDRVRTTHPYAAALVFALACTGYASYALVGAVRDREPFVIAASAVGLAAGVYLLGAMALMRRRGEAPSGSVIGSASLIAASVNFSGGTLAVYDRHHGPRIDGGAGPDALGGYLRLLDRAMDRGAPVSCDGRVMVIVLDSPDDPYLPIDLRVGRAATTADPNMQVSDQFPMSFPTGHLMLGSGDGSPGREGSVPPGDYLVTAGWKRAGADAAGDSPLDSMTIVLRPAARTSASGERTVKLRLEADGVLR